MLSDSATQWRSQAQRLQQAAGVYVDQVNAPNGTEWSGQTAVSYFDAAHADWLAVLPVVTHAHSMADIAEQGGESLRGAQQAALAAIAQAEADDFSVREDLSVTDNYAWNSPNVRAVRQAAAVGHRDYIAHQAALLQAENQRTAAQLNAGAAQIGGSAPAHWRQPVTEYALPSQSTTGAQRPADSNKNRNGTVHAVDHHIWKQEPPRPTPPTPGGMSREQAVAGLLDVNHRIKEHNKDIPAISALPANDPRRLDFTRDTNALNAEKNSYLAVLPPQTVRPSEIIGPGGVKLPGVPPGLISNTPADSGNGWIYPIAPNQPGIDPRVVYIRVMEPLTSGPYQHPNGYINYLNIQDQEVNPFTGRTLVEKGDPLWHIDLPKR